MFSQCDFSQSFMGLKVVWPILYLLISDKCDIDGLVVLVRLTLSISKLLRAGCDNWQGRTYFLVCARPVDYVHMLYDLGEQCRRISGIL